MLGVFKVKLYSNLINLCMAVLAGLSFLHSSISYAGFSEEARLSQNDLISIPILFAVMPMVDGAEVRRVYPYTLLCKYRNGRVVASNYDKVLEGRGEIRPCSISIPIMPGEFCPAWKYKGKCLALRMDQRIYNLPRFRAAIDAAIANPCLFLPIEPEENSFMEQRIPRFREALECDRSGMGNSLNVVIELADGDPRVSWKQLIGPPENRPRAKVLHFPPTKQ